MPPTIEDLDRSVKELQKKLTLVSQFTTPTGTILAFAGSAAPQGWLYCDGSSIGRVEYAALFEVVNESFGAGDGTTTFNVPDLRGRVIIGLGSSPGLSVRELGEVIGSEDYTLTASEIPQHTHRGTTRAASGTHTHVGTVQDGGQHSHGGSTSGQPPHRHSGVTGSTNLFAPIDTRAGSGLIEGQAAIPYGPRAVYPISGTIPHQHTFETSDDGSHSHNLLTDEQPAHAHGLLISDGGEHVHDIQSDGGDGEGKPHSNIQPSLVLNFIIKA